MADVKIRNVLRDLQVADGELIRIAYEDHLRANGILAGDETLSNRPELAATVYQDWQRRDKVACVFARLMALYPSAYDVVWDVISTPVSADNAELVAQEIVDLVEPTKAQEEAVVVLLPTLDQPEVLVAVCKGLGKCKGWNVRAPFNPSDKLERVYVRVTTDVGPNVEAEVLGVGPFAFLPITRQSPITALHVRTKTERAKRRAHNTPDKAHLADIDWPEGRGRRFNQFWEKTSQRRAEVLGGDDSAARARVTFAVPRNLWESTGN